MLIADPPENEAERLEKLRALMVLDSVPEPLFNEVTLLAKQICNIPIAIISLVGQDRQWFKANVGVEETSETPRDYSFCAHVILNDTLLEVPDTLQDARFKDNTLVTNEPNIRFYAGMPITLSGDLNIGSLCVADKKPNKLNNMQKEMLAGLSTIIAKALTFRETALNEITSHATKLAAIVESSNDAIIGQTLDGTITSWNPAAKKIFGYQEKDMLGKLITTIFPMYKLHEHRYFTDTIKTNKSLKHFTTERVTKAGVHIQVSVSLSPIKNATGEIIGISEITNEITAKTAIFEE